MIPELEEAISCITGVDAARIIVDETGGIAEIHIVGPLGRSPKRIVRDTESLLRARYGVSVDYRKISVVQLPPSARAYMRPKLVDVQFQPEDSCVCVTLAGANGEHRCQGAISEDGNPGVAQAAAEVTLRAAGEVTKVPMALRLAESRIVHVGDHDVMFVMVSAEGQGASEELAGTCIVGRCLPTAAAKATLDAINRRLELWSAFTRDSTRSSRGAVSKGV
jgi:hypothetical protein